MKIELRYCLPEDEEFLYQLFISSRPDLQLIAGMQEAEFKAFLYQQYCVDMAQLKMNYPEEKFQIVLLDQKRVGKFFVNSGEKGFRIISIAILPEYQKQGIGSHLMKELIKKASSESKEILLQVAWYNQQAKEWYSSFGFTVTQDNGVFSEMKWISAFC